MSDPAFDLQKAIRVLAEGGVDCMDIQLKRAAGRPRDLEAIAELQALIEERDRR